MCIRDRLKAIGSAEDSCCALNRLQWVRNGLTLTTADDYNSKVLSERGGAGQRVGYTKIGPRASPNRITQNHMHNMYMSNQLYPPYYTTCTSSSHLHRIADRIRVIPDITG